MGLSPSEIPAFARFLAAGQYHRHEADHDPMASRTRAQVIQRVHRAEHEIAQFDQSCQNGQASVCGVCHAAVSQQPASQSSGLGSEGSDRGSANRPVSYHGSHALSPEATCNNEPGFKSVGPARILTRVTPAAWRVDNPSVGTEHKHRRFGQCPPCPIQLHQVRESGTSSHVPPCKIDSWLTRPGNVMSIAVCMSRRHGRSPRTTAMKSSSTK